MPQGKWKRRGHGIEEFCAFCGMLKNRPYHRENPCKESVEAERKSVDDNYYKNLDDQIKYAQRNSLSR